MQLALNAPFGLLWVADKANPAVHAFDMSVLTALHAEWLAPMMGIARRLREQGEISRLFDLSLTHSEKPPSKE